MRSLETKIPPVALTVLLGFVAWLLAILTPSAEVAIPARNIVAAFLVVAGVLVSVLGVMAFRDHKTTVNPTKPETTSQVVSTGVYRYTRNPMYVGFGLVLLAIAVFLGNIASILVVPAYVVYMTQFQIKPEERALLAKFGAPFGQYMASVRRWL